MGHLACFLLTGSRERGSDEWKMALGLCLPSCWGVGRDTSLWSGGVVSAEGRCGAIVATHLRSGTHLVESRTFWIVGSWCVLSHGLLELDDFAGETWTTLWAGCVGKYLVVC